MIDPEIPTQRDGEIDRIRELVDRASLPPLLPKSVTIEETGNGVRVSVVARARGPIDGTTRFDIHWVADCDPSTTTGIDRIVGASIVVDNIPNPAKEDALGEKTVSDGKYRNGWFFITAVNAVGERSGPSQPQEVGEAVHDRSVPDPVQHFTGSESGEQHNGMTFSACSFAYNAPNPLGGFHGLQLVAKDYPTIGEYTALDEEEFNGLGGGRAAFKKQLQVCRRPGLGTVTATAGSPTVTFGGSENALIQVQAGDFIEILGVRGEIQSVDSATQVTLTANWGGQTVAGFASYVFLGKVRFYARSVSAGGGYEEDLTKLPYVDLVLDGELSAPNAPTLVVESAGNIIRAFVTLPPGTEIAEAVLFRGTGAGVAFASCDPIKTWPADQIRPTATLDYEDTDFSAYEKENGQTFTYYAVAKNVRGEPSAPSAAAQASCRLNTTKDGDNPVGKLGLKNLLYNGFIAGTAGNAVRANDVSQDAYMFSDAANLPGVPYNAVYAPGIAQANGTGRFIGHTRWEMGDAGTGAALPVVVFQNGTEVRFSPAGAGKFWAMYQGIEAWDQNTGTARANKIKRGGIFVLSAYFRAAGGPAPNGEMRFFIEQYNNGGAKLGNAKRRYRDNTDALLWSSADYTISCADLGLDWQRFYAVFQGDTTLALTRQFHVNIAWADGTQGNVDCCQVMLNEGEEVGVFTADMDTSYIGWPMNPANPPTGIGDGLGLRNGKYIEP
jgi:hypothetical protein